MIELIEITNVNEFQPGVYYALKSTNENGYPDYYTAKFIESDTLKNNDDYTFLRFNNVSKERWGRTELYIRFTPLISRFYKIVNP
jgi:hypothetical protein